MTRRMTPRDAVQRYLEERKPDLSESSYYNISCALDRFVEFCDEEGIEDITTLDAFHVSDFKLRRREHVSEMTVYNNLCAVRVFVRWLQAMDCIDAGLAENMILPTPDDDARDEMIDRDTAEQIAAYLERFEYATLRHALFVLLWDTGFRVGTARALDRGDYDSDGQYVTVTHRPDTGTPLKNGSNAEREVNLHEWVCEVLDDYIQIHREDVTDDAGRAPLLTTRHGRPHGTTLRGHTNALTRPCHYTGECPHDRDMDDCEATQYRQAQRCPSSVSPHPIRRGAITQWLNEGHRKELISDRMDVSTDTLDKHYDARSESEKRELRRDMFDM